MQCDGHGLPAMHSVAEGFIPHMYVCVL